MRRHAVPLILLLAIAASGAVLSGCAAGKSTKPSAAPGAAETPGAQKAKAALPDEIEVSLTLYPGQSWKSRFVSTGELRQSYTAPDKKTATRARTSGLEIVATQTVKAVNGSVARVEVNELATRILQEGKFVDAPFRQFGPPNPVTFTIDTATGKTDFSEMEKAYSDWMAGIKEGPAGEIMGKSFRLEAYVAQLKELYGKPFNRFARRKISRELRATGEKEFALPFVGPGVSIAPVEVETRLRFEGMDVKAGNHALKVSGEYAGRGTMSQEELDARLADFGAAGGKAGQSTREAKGEFHSTVDVLSGRELEANSRVTYAATALFDGAYAEEILGKLTLDPAE